MPSLHNLGLNNNDLRDLPSIFIQAMLSHPKLNDLTLDGNSKLGCSLNPSTPCAINSLLCQNLEAASSSLYPLRDLQLNNTQMAAACCGPVLEQVLALGSKGFDSLWVSGNPALLSHTEIPIRTLSNVNFSIIMCVPAVELEDQDEGVWEDIEKWEAALLDYDSSYILSSALERNQGLRMVTQQAACGLLAVARTVYLSSPSHVSPSSGSTRSSCRLHTELLQLVLSFIYPSALSDRQTASIIQYAVDRNRLLQGTLERRGRALSHPNREAGILREEAAAFREETVVSGMIIEGTLTPVWLSAFGLDLKISRSCFVVVSSCFLFLPRGGWREERKEACRKSFPGWASLCSSFLTHFVHIPPPPTSFALALGRCALSHSRLFKPSVPKLLDADVVIRDGQTLEDKKMLG